MYSNSNILINGGTATYIARNVVQTGNSRQGFETLCAHVATGALHNSGEVSDQPKCHPGTRVAILDHIISWAAALTYTYPIVWLHGPAGAGKSAILRTIAQLLFDQGLLLGSFFFFRTAPGRNSSDRFIATIAYQLALLIPATRPHIEDAVEKNPLIFSLSIWDQAQALIVFPILAISGDPSISSNQCSRVIVIDGLDECKDPDKQCDILQVMCRLLRKLHIPLAVLVASRPEHHIRSAFDLGDLNKCSSRLSLDDSYKPDADIELYLVDNFNTIKETHLLRSYLPADQPWPSRAIVENLVAKASGQFIYVSTIIKFISPARHNPAQRLNIIIGTINAGNLKPFEQLDILYSTILETIDPVELASTLRILGVLLVPYDEFFDIANHSPHFVESFLILEPAAVRRLLFDLESLLTIGDDKENVHFFHASLLDYLFDRSRSGQFWIDAGAIYADLARHCIIQLSNWRKWPEKDDQLIKGYIFDNIFLLFSKANSAIELHEAIQACDLEKVGGHPPFGFSGMGWPYFVMDFRAVLLQAIRTSVSYHIAVTAPLVTEEAAKRSDAEPAGAWRTLRIIDQNYFCGTYPNCHNPEPARP